MREEFLSQLKDYEFKIKRGEEELAKLKEYKLKLEGGLETLDLLEKQDGSDSSQPTD